MSFSHHFLATSKPRLSPLHTWQEVKGKIIVAILFLLFALYVPDYLVHKSRHPNLIRWSQVHLTKVLALQPESPCPDHRSRLCMRRMTQKKKRAPRQEEVNAWMLPFTVMFGHNGRHRLVRFEGFCTPDIPTFRLESTSALLFAR